MKQRQPLALEVIYLFAGRKRRADIQECLSTLIARINARAEFDFVRGAGVHHSGFVPGR